MKTKVVILSLVAAVFAVMIIAFKGCNDAVDNGVFEEQDAAVVPAEQAPENGEDAVSVLPFNTAKIRAIEAWGATGLGCIFEITVFGNVVGVERKAKGWLWHTTKMDLAGFEGMRLIIRTDDTSKPLDCQGSNVILTGYEYSPTGDVLYIEVWGGFVGDIHISRSLIN